MLDRRLSKQFLLPLNAYMSINTLKHIAGRNLGQLFRLHFMQTPAVDPPFGDELAGSNALKRLKHPCCKFGVVVECLLQMALGIKHEVDVVRGRV